jgi:hypothetical protein
MAKAARLVLNSKSWNRTKLTKEEWEELEKIMLGEPASEERREYFRQRL